MKNKISFIIPAYNCEKTLCEAVDSIFNGNFQNGDEIIIVNDASSDSTKTVAEDVCRKYEPFVKLINNEQNKGCPASRNIGIRNSKNEFIFNLDSDDVLEKDSVDKLKMYLIENNADLATFGEIHYFIKDIKNITHKWLCKTGVLTLSDYLSGPIVPGGNYIYTKTSWEKISGYWEYGKGLHEFWGFTLKQLINKSKIVVMPGSYYFHRYSHRSLYARESKNIEESIKITNKFIEPIFDILDDETKIYVKENPNWFNNFDKHPLILRDHTKGKTGKIAFVKRIDYIKYRVKNIVRYLVTPFSRQ
jgi:glycosyltransferase involved in cell wall biosynthesis